MSEKNPETDDINTDTDEVVDQTDAPDEGRISDVTPDENIGDTTEVSDDDAQDDTDAEDRPGRDAAKYRRRLRETEAERDTLTAQVEALQRAAVDTQAAAQAIKPAALWASGVALADLLTETGTVDPAKVAAACSAARESLGLGRRYTNRVPGEGNNPAPAPAGGGLEGMVDVVMGR